MMDLLPLREVKASFPEFTAQLAQSWVKFCPWLGRPIATGTDPGNRHGRTYSLADLRAAFDARRTEPLPDEFSDKDGRWVWLQTLRQSDEFAIAATSVMDWQERGHEALGGKLQVRREWYWPIGGLCHRRDYVRAEDLEMILAHRADDTELPDDWAPLREAERVLSAPTLIKYSRSTHYRRKGMGMPLPLLGRPIKTSVRKVITNRQTVWRTFYWRPDITRLTAALWATWRQARDEYDIPSSTLDAAVRRGDVKRQKFAVAPAQGRPSEQQFFRRSDLDRLARGRQTPTPRTPQEAARRTLTLGDAINAVKRSKSIVSRWAKERPQMVATRDGGGRAVLLYADILSDVAVKKGARFASSQVDPTEAQIEAAKARIRAQKDH
jgi:hypothetical protein